MAAAGPSHPSWLPRARTACLALLLAGAAVNLAAGARRPPVERAILSRGHYPAADRAAEAVRRHVPPGEPLAVVVYEGDVAGGLDHGIWFDYRLKWLLYPRSFTLFVRREGGELERRISYEAQRAQYVPAEEREALSHRNLLFFRATALPSPFADLEIQARDPMWVLARTPGR